MTGTVLDSVDTEVKSAKPVSSWDCHFGGASDTNTKHIL